MSRAFVIHFIFSFTCLFNLNASVDFQEDNPFIFSPAPFEWDSSQFAQSQLKQLRLIQPKLTQPSLAQSKVRSNQDGFEEPGEYAVFPRSQARVRRFGFRVFGGLNFAWNIRSRYNNSYNNTFNGFGNRSTEYIFPHTSLLGSLSFGGSFFFLATKEIGAMFSAIYEIESKVEQYKYKRLNESVPTSPTGGSCPTISPKDNDYFLCPLADQFSYSIISLELSGFYKVLPSLYVFAGPNFFIPIGFKVQPVNGQINPIPFEIKGELGGQAGIGFVYQKFFIEGLFKTQNFILEGIRLNSATGNLGNPGNSGVGIFETGRLWGFMLRGGFQF